MHINVSDLKQAEAAMHRSEARLRAIVDTAVDGIVVINDRGIIESVNPAVTRMFGYAPEQLLGQNVKLLMPDPIIRSTTSISTTTYRPARRK